jgi:hypothetical protein
MKTTFPFCRRKGRLTAALRNIAFWTAISLSAVFLSGVYEWLDTLPLN